jgi:hypothetical protein
MPINIKIVAQIIHQSFDYHREFNFSVVDVEKVDPPSSEAAPLPLQGSPSNARLKWGNFQGRKLSDVREGKPSERPALAKL